MKGGMVADMKADMVANMEVDRRFDLKLMGNKERHCEVAATVWAFTRQYPVEERVRLGFGGPSKALLSQFHLKTSLN